VLKAVLASAAVPVKDVTVATTFPVVNPSIVVRVLAAIDVSVNVIFSLPNPEIPADPYALVISTADPVIDVIVEASTTSVEFVSRVLRVDAVIDVSLVVMETTPVVRASRSVISEDVTNAPPVTDIVSLPKPVMVPAELAA